MYEDSCHGMVTMLMRSFLLMCCAFLIAGCPLSPEVKSPLPMAMPLSGQVVRHPPAFTRVKVIGTLNVNLRTGFRQPHIILRGNPHDLPQVITTVINNTLTISLRKPFPKFGPIQVDINSQHLNAFEYHGRGEVTGNQIKTRLLDLILDNNGRTTLRGQLGLHQVMIIGDGYTEITGINSPFLMLKLSGKSKVRLGGLVNISALDIGKGGSLTLYWVKSKVLTVRGRNNAFIQLAGVVEHLDVELWGTSTFKGRYLRADRAFVKTHDKSIAEISAVKRQHTLAKGASDIQFFNIPVMKADFMANNGAVLDMRDLGPPYIQEYNQYNK